MSKVVVYLEIEVKLYVYGCEVRWPLCLYLQVHTIGRIDIE